MKIWVDDIRTPPDDDWTWIKTSRDAIFILSEIKRRKRLGRLEHFTVTEMSLDHDLGGDDTTRPIVLWCCENDFWPVEVRIHSQNPIGVTWLQGMIDRYHPSNADKYNR